jgi:hypothetical protein
MKELLLQKKKNSIINERIVPTSSSLAGLLTSTAP